MAAPRASFQNDKLATDDLSFLWRNPLVMHQMKITLQQALLLFSCWHLHNKHVYIRSEHFTFLFSIHRRGEFLGLTSDFFFARWISLYDGTKTRQPTCCDGLHIPYWCILFALQYLLACRCERKLVRQQPWPKKINLYTTLCVMLGFGGVKKTLCVMTIVSGGSGCSGQSFRVAS